MLKRNNVYLRLIDVIVLSAAGKAIIKSAKEAKDKRPNIKRLEEAVKRADKLIKREKAK